MLFISSLKKTHFYYGLRKGLPILLGYFPVSFAFGMMAANSGIPPLLAVCISLSNFTSAGQMAGTQLIAAGAAYLEIGTSLLVINLRYLLMSLSLSQKIMDMSLIKKLFVAFGITDEIYVVSSLEKEALTFTYFLGLIIGPYIGWALGTACGAFVSSILPEALKNAMDITLYAMFIALVVPESKKSKSVLITVIISMLISSMFKWLFIFQTKGFAIIFATLISASVTALLFPQNDNKT